MWDNEAKEKELKQQFVAHVTKYERVTVRNTCGSCTHQVER
jgi:hypothetical protein